MTTVERAVVRGRGTSTLATFTEGALMVSNTGDKALHHKRDGHFRTGPVMLVPCNGSAPEVVIVEEVISAGWDIVRTSLWTLTLRALT